MPGKINPHISESGIDTRRRMLLGGVAGAVTTALLAGCKQKEAPKAVAPVVVAEPEVVDMVVAPQDVNIPVGMEALPVEELAYASKLLAASTSIDVHCHPGMFFFEGTEPEDPMLQKMASVAGFQDRTVGDMAAGGLGAALFATVADIRLIGAGQQGLFARREFAEGEAYQNHLRQLVTLNKMVETGLVMQARTPADVIAAKQAGQTAAIFSCEGGDFLEENIDRIEEAWQAGIRSIGLVHYHVNHMGDIQTSEPVHNGLTRFGKQAVAEMNRVGMIVDLAHATYMTSKDAIAASSQPVMLSHSFLEDDATQNPRLISADHALMVAETGGLIGAWPTGIGNPDFMSFIDRLLRLVDVVGIDHVGLGTDMDANYKPVFTNYRQMPYIPAVLKRRGMRDEDIIKVLGGNFMRVFDEVTRAGENS
jgi:membrane dipeptidase